MVLWHRSREWQLVFEQELSACHKSDEDMKLDLILERLWYFGTGVENGYIITIHFITHLRYISEIMEPD